MLHAISVFHARPLPPTHSEAIREIFLRRRIEYTMREAAALLRLTLGDFLGWVDSGVLNVETRTRRKQLGGRRHAIIRWNELASAAMLRWSVMQIHDALGKEANATLPRLLRPIELKGVRLPEYLIRLLETFAQHAGVSVEAYLCTILLALEAEANPEEMEQLLPGFIEAVRFPDA